MKTLEKVSKDILESLHYSSLQDAGLTMVQLNCRAKRSEYRADDEYYEKKYGISYIDFKKKVESKLTEECFEEEDDLLAWQYAHEARAYWEQKVLELE